MEDPRRQRSQLAIQNAFFGLVLSKRYSEISIDELVERSGVARSTFYACFASKDALLTSSLRGPFEILAGAFLPHGNRQRIPVLLEHFWENRGIARTLFSGNCFRKLVDALAIAIAAELKGRQLKLILPAAVVAHTLAEAYLALIREWLLGRAACTSAQLTNALLQLAQHAFVEMS
jgi:AcrR family transcriptional regulator